MKSYCLKCRKDTENINPKVSSTSNGKAMILSQCAICGSKKSETVSFPSSRMKEILVFHALSKFSVKLIL